MTKERSLFQNDVEELVGYLEDRFEHGANDDDFDFEELYYEYKKHGVKVFKDIKFRSIVKKLDDEVAELYG